MLYLLYKVCMNQTVSRLPRAKSLELPLLEDCSSVHSTLGWAATSSWTFRFLWASFIELGPCEGHARDSRACGDSSCSPRVVLWRCFGSVKVFVSCQ